MSGPRCHHLRAKGMYIPEIAHEAFDESHQAICWCSRTLGEIGPDGEPVGQFVCDGDRPCYEPAAGGF